MNEATQTMLAPAGKMEVGLNDFELIKVLGKGGFGKVFLVIKKDEPDKPFAMKAIRKDIVIETDMMESIKFEKSVLEKAQHPFLMNCTYIFKTENRFFFIMRFVQGGELFEHLRRANYFTEDVVRFMIAQMVLAIGHLHSDGIIYRDIKPENILVDHDGYLCLCDYGLAKFLEEDESTETIVGTAEYMAPEILRGMAYSFPVDWWAIGNLTYELITGRAPFSHNRANQMKQDIQNKPIRQKFV